MRATTNVRHALLYFLVASLPILGSGCAATVARVTQFESFALAGTRFADAVPDVLDESFKTTVNTSSLVLVQARKGLSDSARLEEIERNDSTIRQRLEFLNDLKRHAKLLRRYFVALQSLALTDAQSSGLTDVTSGLVSALGEISPNIASATVAGASISELVSPAATLAFAAFQSKVLEAELRRNALTVDRELSLQQAALTALSEAMRADLEAQFEVADRDKIALPYVRDGELPADWSQRRLEAFQRHIRLASVDAASQAAGDLRLSFVALVEDRLDRTMIGALLADINGIVTFLARAGTNE